MSGTTFNELLIEDDVEEESAAPKSPSLKTRFGESPPTPGAQIARRMLWAACPAVCRRDIERRRSLVVIVEAPATWIDLIQEAARDLIRPADFVVNERKPGPRTWSLQELGLRNAMGLRRSFVILTTQGVSGISPSVLAAADHHIRIAPPDRPILAAALKAVFGLRRSPRLPAKIDATGDGNAIVAAIRPGESAGRAIRRLASLSKDRPMSILDLPEGPGLSDLHGYGAAKEWGLALAHEIDAFRAGAVRWAAISSAAILHGAPGVGKTYFAAALARTCKIPLTRTSLGQLFASTAGDLDSIVKGLDRAFEEARAKGPSILFIDELDALPDRKMLTGRGRDWWSPICNHFLKLLDDARDRVVVLAATNMIDRIDDAILRPGRIDRHFEIALPDHDALVQMLKHHVGDDLAGINLAPVARLAQGHTGARIELSVKAARAAARQAERALEFKDLLDQFLPQSEDLHELRRICVHEAGHALVAHLLGRRVRHVTTLGDDQRGGCVEMEPLEGAVSRRQIEDQVTINLAGRGAEILLLGCASSGAHTDLKVATQLLAALHGSFGLGDSLIHLATALDPSVLIANSRLQTIVESDLQRLDARCTALLSEHRLQLQVITDALAIKRVVDGEELARLVGSR
ncbi:AAA family ATPase [Bosea sp. NPDC003192]|uniref:AAA family ATPase n=1 Tax=Bosea sp. NPDC003192 TaxID=3390551 RepID=UPI003D0507F0